MKIPNEVYNVLKWVGLILLPACAWLVAQIAPAWGWENTEAIVTTLNATGTFIGILIGVSTLSYYKDGGTDE
jgi:hypothetical protein